MNKKTLFLTAVIIIGVNFFVGVKFSLADDPSITVLSPNGGESYEIKSDILSGALTIRTVSVSISWRTNYDPQSLFIISFVDSLGNQFGTRTALGQDNAVSGQTRSYNLIEKTSSIIGLEDNRFKVKICSTQNSVQACDVSDSFFTITPSSAQSPITVLSPNGGEIWSTWQTQMIRWSVTGSSSIPLVNISIVDVSTSNPVVTRLVSNYNDIINYTPGSYIWTISDAIKPGTYKVYIINPEETVWDYSDAPFTITAPITQLSASCSGTASNNAAPLINWQAQVTGGSGSYGYAWSIYNDVSSYGEGGTQGQTVTVNYSSIGAKEAVIIVTDGTGQRTSATCHATIPVFSAQTSINVDVRINGQSANASVKNGDTFVLSYIAIGATYCRKEMRENNWPLADGSGYWDTAISNRPTSWSVSLENDKPAGTTNTISITCYDDTGYSQTGTAFFNSAASTRPSLAASLLNSFEDRAGLWQNFGPGVGNINKNPADWNWTATLKLPSQKTIARMTIAHNNNGEVWSTGYSRYLKNGTDLYGYEEHPYPLVVVFGKQQLNSSYDQELGTYGAGTNSTFILYGQPESAQFIGGKLIVEFTDGTIIPAPIMASNYRPSVTTPGGTVSIEVKEQVKCVFKFKGTASEQKCYTAGDNSRAVCTGAESCVADISGSSGEKIAWKSSCGGYAYTVMDGSNKYAIFNCAASASPTATTTAVKLKDAQILDINEKSKLLSFNNFDFILAELNQLRSIIKEQQTQIRYLSSLVRDVKNLSQKTQDALNNFITYGVDANTEKLGAGERAAVINSYKAAFDKLPETEAELADAIKIANGRFPSVTSAEAEKTAKEQFVKIYKRAADLNDANDNAAIKVMAYGLRQKAENRNLNSEKAGIRIFKAIYGHVPSSTEDWNIMQAITYSGASRTSNVFSLSDIKIGSKVGEMNVVSINPFNQVYNTGVPPTKLSDDNVSVEFWSEVTITGNNYYLSGGMLDDMYCFNNIDEASLKKLPKLNIDNSSLWFCFSNQADAKELLGKQPGKVKIVIDKYTLNRYPADIWSNARLKKVVNKE